MSIESHHVEGKSPLREILCSCYYLLDKDKGKHKNQIVCVNLKSLVL